MPKKGANISLTSYDDIFSTEESRSEEKLEKVQMIPLSELHPFKNHPFKVLDDEAMLRTIESVSQYGVLVPGIVRPRPEGGYEIVAGHRRHHALELIGKEYERIDSRIAEMQIALDKYNQTFEFEVEI